MSPKKPFNITLEPEQIEFLRILEKATGASASEHIRRAITVYIREVSKTLGPAVDAELKRKEAEAAAYRKKAKAKKGK